MLYVTGVRDRFIHITTEGNSVKVGRINISPKYLILN